MKNPFSLEGKTALVTGASRGIGAACARALAYAGAHVALAARSREEMQRLADSLPHNPRVFEADLSQEGAAKQLADEAIAAFGGLDILVNNAGVSAARRTHKLDEGQIDFIMDVNVRGLILLSGAVARSMMARGSGSIINISSVSSLRGSPYQAAYAASKGAVDAATRSMAAEWGPSGVRVNSVNPGVIITDMWTDGRARPGVVETIERQVALRRWGLPEDIADTVVFLASDAARYVTAQSIAVDGGLSGCADLLTSAERFDEARDDARRA